MGVACEPAIWTCAATCTRGLERVVAGELEGLGVESVAPHRGVVSFAADPAAVLRANLWLRSAMRVLVELGGGRAATRGDLYELARGVAWEAWLERGATVAVTVAGQSKAFASAAFAALVVKDALVDRLRDRLGWRPEVDRRAPDLRVWLHLSDDRTALGVDSTGEPLSHRGYRPRGGPAPLAESLAAGVLLLAGYDGTQRFLDPMCGTGTLAIEAALIATRTAPGLRRRFACERWASLDRRRCDEERARARDLRRPAPAAIDACDADPRAVAATAANARAAGVAEVLAVSRGDARALRSLPAGTLVVANPPYGERLGRGEDLSELYRELGESLRRSAQGCSAWLLAGDPELVKSVRLRPAQRLVLFNDPIECRLVRYDIRAAAAPPQRPDATP